MADAFFTRAPSTIVTIPLTGQLEFTIPFEFLARKFVVVTLLGTDRKVLTLNTDYRFIAVNKIRLERQPDGQYTRIELRRYTSATDRLVTFIDGSILRATDLNLAQVQTMHVAEEARDMTSDNIGVNDDGDLDARNRKIVNLADAENDLDAVNLGQLKQFDTSTSNNAYKAERSAEAAKLSETNAANSEDRCVVAEAKATSSAGTAMTAAADANRSKVVAKQSEDNVLVLVPRAEKAATDAEQSAKDAEYNAQNINTLGGLPIGTIVMFGTTTIPAGFLSLMYDNPTFNVTEYPDLARLYPDGRLPSYKDRVPEGIGNGITIGQKRAGSVGLTTTMTLVASSVGDHVHSAWTDQQGAHSHFYNAFSQDAGVYEVQNGGRAWGYSSAGTSTTGAHAHNVGVGGAGAHNHTVTGSVGAGRNLVDATGTVFAIKAATGATPDALQVAAAISGRVTELESWPQYGVQGTSQWIKHRDGTLEQIFQLTIPATPQSRDIRVQEAYPVGGFISKPYITWSIADELSGAGALSHLGQVARTGFHTTLSTKDSIVLIGYTYNEPILAAVRITCRAIGRWK